MASLSDINALIDSVHEAIGLEDWDAAYKLLLKAQSAVAFKPDLQQGESQIRWQSAATMVNELMHRVDKERQMARAVSGGAGGLQMVPMTFGEIGPYVR